MISHLRMEGKYLLFTDQVPANKHFHLFFILDDGSTLVYQDVRKFGTFDLLAKIKRRLILQRKSLVLSLLRRLLNTPRLREP